MLIDHFRLIFTPYDERSIIAFTNEILTGLRTGEDTPYFVSRNILVQPYPFASGGLVMIVGLILVLFATSMVASECRKEKDEESPAKSVKHLGITDIVPEKKTDVLLERYRQSWNQQILIHDLQWKGITILAPVITALLGLVVIKRELVIPMSLSSIVLISAGLFITYRNREVFLQHMMIIARTEKLLGLHESYPELEGRKLLPEVFIDIANKTYEDFIRSQFWKWKSTFFGIFCLYNALIIITIGIWIAVGLGFI